jgi:hypothetical protein
MQIAWPRLRAQTGFDSNNGGPFSGFQKATAPFTLAPIEHQNGVAPPQPQDAEEIICLATIERDVGARSQRRIDKKPGHAKFVARHGVNCRKTMAGFYAFWQDYTRFGGPFRRLPDAFGLL